MSQVIDEDHGIDTVYKSADDYVDRYGMAVALGHHTESDTFSIGVFNGAEGLSGSGYTVLEREELLRLRDAITMRLGS